MISNEERKIGLFMQIQKLIKELQKFRQQEYEELQLSTRTSRLEFINGVDLISNFNSKEK